MDNQAILQKIIDARQVLNSQKKQYYSQHFYEFNRDILKWPDLYEPLHRRVCDFVQDNWKTKKLLLLLPRGTFKSSVVTVGFSLWQIAINPDVRILISNAVYPLAVSFLSQIKKHIQTNETFKEIFGELYIPTEQWREDRISVSSEKLTHKEPTIWAFGMGASSVGSHFNIALLDDLVARENISTKEQIEKTKNYYRDVLDLVDPMPGGHRPVIIVGTTWHWDDLYSWIMDPRNQLIGDFAVLRLPAYTGEFGKGELLFPSRLDWKSLQKLKEQQGSYHFSAQYMLNPVPEENQTFKSPFPVYEQTDLSGVELTKFMSIDPALSESDTADFSAITVVGVDRNNTWYILDVWRGQVQPSKLIDQIFYMDDKWHPISIGLETTAFQKVLQYQINDEMKKRGRFLPIKELKGRGGIGSESKEDRIRALQPRYEQKTIYHPERASIPLIEYLEDELLRFPRGANDDIIDSLASNLELAFPPRKREERSVARIAHYPA